MTEGNAVFAADETVSSALAEASENAAETTADVPAAPVAADDTDRAASGRVEAVWRALAANPGSSATAIGVEVSMSRVAVGKILARLEADGRAVRTPGGHDGRKRTPDIWHPVAPAAEEPVPAPGHASDQENAGPGDMRDSAAGDLAPAEAAPEDASPIETTGNDGSPDEIHGLPADGGATGEAPPEPVYEQAVPEDEPTPEPPHDREPEADDPAREEARRELMDLAEMLLGTVEAMDNGDIAGALGRLELLQADVARVRRTARAALTGTKRAATGSGAIPARPGQLRDRVLSHLKEHPGKDFTPYEIGRVLGNSAGAVANALDRLVSLGEAELTCERPRRFAATAAR